MLENYLIRTLLRWIHLQKTERTWINEGGGRGGTEGLRKSWDSWTSRQRWLWVWNMVIQILKLRKYSNKRNYNWIAWQLAERICRANTRILSIECHVFQRYRSE